MLEASETDEFQAFLDGMVDSIRARDFEAFREHIALPVTMINAHGTQVIAGTDDLRAGFEGYVAALDGHGVTDYVRVVTSITRVSPILASCTYMTHLLRNSVRVVEPYPSAVMLRRDDGVWRATSFMVSLTHDRWRFRLPGTDDGSA